MEKKVISLDQFKKPQKPKCSPKKWPDNRRTCFDEEECFCPDQPCCQCLYYKWINKGER